MPDNRILFPVKNIANAVLAGPWTRESLLDRLSRATGDNDRWRETAARGLFRAFGKDRPPQRVEEVIAFLLSKLGKWAIPLAVREVFSVVPLMRNRHQWPIPQLPTTNSLAEWLDVTANQLQWYADAQARNPKSDDTRLHHYRWHWIPKSGGRWRLLEIPKPNLKAIQRRVLHEILDKIPVHDAAHAFRAGRSIVSYARPHEGQAIVLRIDLRDFFPSIPAARVHAVFAEAGYPVDVARLLTGLCTTIAPARVWHGRPGRAPEQWHANRHLPQGAPASPALANLCARGLDIRLSSLAKSVGANYSRYADDLAFSGDRRFAGMATRFYRCVGVVAMEEGFELNHRKHRFMRAGGCQRLTGLVVNQKANVARATHDRLKAIVHNCVRYGPSSQNRDGRSDFRAWLRGQVGFLVQVNPGRGARLLHQFHQIQWDESLA